MRLRPITSSTPRLPSGGPTVLAATGLVLIGFTLGSCATGATEPTDGTTTVASGNATPMSAADENAASPQDGQPVTSGPNSILSPGDGAVVSGPSVTVSGDGTAFEGTLLYAVYTDEDQPVAEGFTSAGANGEVGPYEIELSLSPGSYTVQVWEAEMTETESDGGKLNMVEVAFTVS
jgi:hypothetical protein